MAKGSGPLKGDVKPEKLILQNNGITLTRMSTKSWRRRRTEKVKNSSQRVLGVGGGGGGGGGDGVKILEGGAWGCKAAQDFTR